MGLSESELGGLVPVPARILAAAIRGLDVGAEAFLDRDWDCYSPAERAEAERYVEETFTRVARTLETL